MRQLANTFPGAVLVFSTLRKSLTPQEIKSITRIAKRRRKYWKSDRPINPVLILTGTELLHFSGPPHCWEESLQKKFDHVYGLIALCDATQQIYLNLPSWQTEWHEKWEKKRELLQAKISVAQQPDSSKMPVQLLLLNPEPFCLRRKACRCREGELMVATWGNMGVYSRPFLKVKKEFPA
jgi:hypothetical protein